MSFLWNWLAGQTSYKPETPIRTKTDNPDLRQVFTESCQMYRHFLMMRYYSVAGCGVFSAALIAAWLQRRAELHWFTAIPLCMAGTIVAAFCCFIDFRLTVIGTHLAQQCDRLSKELIGIDLLEPNQKRPLVWVPFLIVGAVFFLAALAWILNLILYLLSTTPS